MIDNLDESTIKSNSTPTKLSLIEQLLEESKNILPLTAKRSAKISTIKATSSKQTVKTTLSSILPIKSVHQTTTQPSKTQTTAIQPTSKWLKVKAISIRAHPTPPFHHSTTKTTQKISTSPETTQKISTQKTTILAETDKTTQETSLKPTSKIPPKTTKHEYKNEEERLMEFLMNPRPGSKIEFIGEDDSDEKMPELIMFEIAAKETRKPFIPTFHPFPLRNSNPNENGTSTSTQPPCHQDPYPVGLYPGFPGASGMGQGNMHSIMPFGPQNPIVGNGMGGFGNDFGFG